MRIVIIFALIFGLAACAPTIGLAPGLSARMDAPGARLDQTAALSLINSLRAARGVAPATASIALAGKAQTLANQYAGSGKAPKKPEGAKAIRFSAGYTSFAETFSGWRASSTETAALVDPAMTQIGIGVTYNANSTYGTHWVLLLNGNQ